MFKCATLVRLLVPLAKRLTLRNCLLLTVPPKPRLVFAMKYFVSLVFSWIVLFAAIQSEVQGQGTKADYERMNSIRQRTAGKVFRTSISPNWLPDGEHLWYRVRTGTNAFEFVVVDLAAGTRELAFDHEFVAKSLTEATGKSCSASSLPFRTIQWNEGVDIAYFKFDSRRWKINRRSRERDSVLEEVVDESEWRDATFNEAVSLLPSTSGGDEIEVRFVNNSAQVLQLVWIDTSGRRVPYQQIPVSGSVVQHTYEGHNWLVLNAKQEAVAVYEGDAAELEVVIDGKRILNIPEKESRRRGRGRSRGGSPNSPSGEWRAVVSEGKLVIRASEGTEELLGEASGKAYFDDRRFYWSPDSKYLVALEVEPGFEREIHMIESAPKGQLQPKLHTMRYVKPGDKIQTEVPRLFNVETKSEIETDTTLYASPYRMSRFSWREDSSEFVFHYNQRGHQAYRIIGITPENGRVRAIVNEETETFIDYTNKVYSLELSETGELLWMSERSGWNHLYLYDSNSGDVKNAITKGEWVVRGIERVDVENRQVWFTASGIVEGEDPYYIQYCRVDFDGENLVVLTEGNGTHRIEFSPDKRFLVDRYSRVDLPEVTTVRRVSDGSLVCELERGDHSQLLAADWTRPERFQAKGRDGKTDIHGVIYFPSDFDPAKKYPVVEEIYAGPHGSFVPKRFSVNSQKRSLAELGFIVVQIDGMGTSNRSKAFHDVCWKNLGDSGFPDRILWMRAAAEKFPQMDLKRVGIYGGSAGGQSALRALLAYGEFYKVAVSDCGCHDNRMDKIWWNEQWMGWPIGPHYAEQSNVTNAHKLQGKLLLIVGELDRNVDPASTMQVVDALIKADKDFDLIVVPGAGHGIGSGRYGMRRTRDFFVRNLLGVEPRAQ